MRKLVESSFVSLDGVVGSPEKLAPSWSAENRQYALEELSEFDAFVFGRGTYEMFATRWSAVKGDAYYDRINAMPKYVASRTLRDTTWNASLLGEDAAAELQAIKRRPGKDLVKYGSGDLDRMLVERGLVDEFRLSIFPIVLGAGRRLFEGIDTRRLTLARTDTKTFANGIVRVTYAAAYA